MKFGLEMSNLDTFDNIHIVFRFTFYFFQLKTKFSKNYMKVKILKLNIQKLYVKFIIHVISKNDKVILLTIFSKLNSKKKEGN